MNVNVEGAQAARENVYEGIRAILSSIAYEADDKLEDPFPKKNWRRILEEDGAFGALRVLLGQWSKQSSLPLILMIDEIDSLVGDTLIAVLRQLRAGYDDRPEKFPQSIILCGVRDVRDYRIHSNKEKAIITGGSAFNVKAKSLRLGNFTQEEIRRLYQYHTQETGQTFEEEVLEEVWSLSEGQPWLVNALAYQACFEMKEGRDRSRPITLKQFRQAAENLILNRETHLDQLLEKLKEERVRRVIAPLLAGTEQPSGFLEDDLLYLHDLGLIHRNPQVRISNKIYREIIPRALTYSTQVAISQETSWYLKENGMLDMEKLLGAFQEFFRKHSEHWLQRFQYQEAGPQLLLQAFLQRIVNGGGRVEREYGLGRMRVDLYLEWPYQNGLQKVVIELKLLHQNKKVTMAQGLAQTAAYMDICGTEEGHLLIFDRSKKTWSKKIYQKKETCQGHRILVWGC